VEIPVTTMPLLRLPFHLSYVMYLSAISPAAGLAYFRTALAMCRALNVAPSVLLHPLDFLAAEDCPELGFFPAMGMPLARKIKVVEDCFDVLCEHYEVVTMSEHARRASLAGLEFVERQFQLR
jgi:hypothetical protein